MFQKPNYLQTVSNNIWCVTQSKRTARLQINTTLVRSVGSRHHDGTGHFNCTFKHNCNGGVGGGGFSMHRSSLASTEPSYPPCCRQGFGFRREMQLKQQFPVRKTKPEHSGTDLHKALFLRLHLLREEWKRNRAEMLMDGRPK